MKSITYYMEENKKNIFLKSIRKKVFHPIDVYFGMFFAEKFRIQSYSIILLLVVLNFFTRIGFSCISIEFLCFKKISKFFLKKKFFYKIWKMFGKNSSSEWKREILKEKFFKKKKLSPIILEENRIYIYKIWEIEKKIAIFIIKKSKENFVSEKKSIDLINSIFYKKIFSNWEKIAVYVSINKRISFISTRYLYEKIQILQKFLKILQKIKYKKKFLVSIFSEEQILLRKVKNFLKNKVFKKKEFFFNNFFSTQQLVNFKFKKIKKIFFRTNILVIDNFSIVDIFTFEKIIKCIRKKTKILIFGSQKEVFSLKSGKIFYDIFHFYKFGYSKKQVEQIRNFLPCFKKNQKKFNKKYCISDCIYAIERKKKTYDISKIISSIPKKNSNKLTKIIFSKKKNTISISRKEIKINQFIRIIENICSEYKKNFFIKEKKIEKIIFLKKNFCILCEKKNGFLGSTLINKLVENGIKKMIPINTEKFLVIPIILKEDSKKLNLKKNKITFLIQKKEKIYLITKKKFIFLTDCTVLPKHEKAFSLTIQEAKNLHFESIVILFPIKNFRFTKELLDKAIDITNDKILFWSSKKNLQFLINNKQYRETGLSKKIEILSS
ncbi:hypothetical protein [bacterium endosymbiont of Pedicinus badii]|uniref:hypothetical protein n=1 Tax=bacterium endosymbiont of Pedicinus badii TaxID=1719126 RepID=UPI0009BABD19|nr:hypothetical protein [bacterium endosymbiont of Pedicinus badii]OQM34004.1 hypothetical protein AOQ89_01420 [bacterium endosymbiont of Pedicinus badii]